MAKFGPLINTHFLDANNYPLLAQDEHSITVRELLIENINVIRLKIDEVGSTADIKLNSLNKKSEIIFRTTLSSSNETSPPEFALSRNFLNKSRYFSYTT